MWFKVILQFTYDSRCVEPLSASRILVCLNMTNSMQDVLFIHFNVLSKTLDGRIIHGLQIVLSYSTHSESNVMVTVSKCLPSPTL